MTIDQLMSVPLETRQAWTQHRTGLNFEGRSVCERCGIELPRMMPVVQDVCTHGRKLYIGPVPDATPCGGNNGR